MAGYNNSITDINSKVGIGTGQTEPASKLEVNGVTFSRGGSFSTPNDIRTDVGIVIAENDFIYTVDGSFDYLRRLIGKASDIIQIGEPGTSLIDGINLKPGTSGGYVQIFNNASVAAKFVDGKLGLGVTDNSSGDYGTLAPKLHVLQSSTSGAFNLIARFQAGGDAEDTGGAILINHTNDRGLLIEAGRGGAGAIADDEAVSHLGLVQSNGTNTRVMTLRQKNASGDIFGVGIGLEVPQAKLHIGPLTGGDGTAQERLRLTGDYTATGSGALLRFTNQHDNATNPNTEEYNLAGIKGYDYQSDWGGALAFQTAPSTSGGGNLTDRVIINQFGDIKFNNYGLGTLVSDADGNITSSAGGGQGGPYLKDTTDTFTGSLTIVGDIRGSGQQLVLNAGESYSYATGQTNEYVYANAENGLLVSSSPDNWATGWAGRNTAYINRADGSSALPGNLSIPSGGQLFLDGGGNTYITQDIADRLRFFTGGAEFMRFTEDTANLISFFQPSAFSGLVTAPTPANATDDNTLATTAFVKNLIAELPAGLIYKGAWNADTNTPTLAAGGGEIKEGTTTTLTTDKLIDSSAAFTTAPAVAVNDRVRVVTPAGPEFALVSSVDSATQLTLASDIVTATGEAYIVETPAFLEEGNYYIVSDDGATDLNGITDWKVGDWVVASSTNVWQKIDNSSVLDGSGIGQTLPLWTGSGASNTLGNSIITQSSTLISVAGKLAASNTGTAGVPVLDIINTSTSTFNHSLEVMTPNMTTGQNNIIVIGRASSTKNSGYIGYKYSGTAGSNANVLTFGHWGSDNLMNIDGIGNVGIGIINPSEKLEVVGNVKIKDGLLSNQENTNIDAATSPELVGQVATATYTAAFFDFVVIKGTNIRSGTVYACHDGTNVEFTETSTRDLGDTSDVTLSVDKTSTQLRLLATVTSDDWIVKSLIRAI